MRSDRRNASRKMLNAKIKHICYRAFLALLSQANKNVTSVTNLVYRELLVNSSFLSSGFAVFRFVLAEA